MLCKIWPIQDLNSRPFTHDACALTVQPSPNYQPPCSIKVHNFLIENNETIANNLNNYLCLIGSNIVEKNLNDINKTKWFSGTEYPQPEYLLQQQKMCSATMDLQPNFRNTNT